MLVVSPGWRKHGTSVLGVPCGYECEWVVWVDPPPPARVGLAFEELHGVIEHSWIKSHYFEKRAVDLAKKNRVLNKEREKMKGMVCVSTMLFPIIIICMLAISMVVCAQNAH